MTENLNVGGKAAIIYAGTGYFEQFDRKKTKPEQSTAINTESSPDGQPNAENGPDAKPQPGTEANPQPAPQSETPTGPDGAPVAKKEDKFEAQPFLYSPFGTVRDTNRNGKQDPGEDAGRYVLGLAIQNPAKGSRIAAYSDIAWISEMGLRFQVEQRNAILAADTLFWMTESGVAAALPAEPRNDRSIQLTEDLKLRNLILGVVVIPIGLSLLLGLGLYFYRKNRRFQGSHS